MPSPRTWLVVASLLGFLAVAAGAFGAHGLEIHLSKDGSLTAADERQIDIWETAARYQMYHALALLAVGLLAIRRPRFSLRLAGVCFTLGTLIFSGCLYTLVLTQIRWLGAIVPIGGTLFLLGWLFLAVASWRLESE